MFNLRTVLAFDQQILNSKYYKARESAGRAQWLVSTVFKDAKPELQTALASSAPGEGRLVRFHTKWVKPTLSTGIIQPGFGFPMLTHKK